MRPGRAFAPSPWRRRTLRPCGRCGARVGSPPPRLGALQGVKRRLIGAGAGASRAWVRTLLLRGGLPEGVEAAIP
eukprot:5312722-Lingulodinium_polyedra.AAC.1